MSTTDDRAALERIAALNSYVFSDARRAITIARAILAAVPAEPEAWEWRAVHATGPAAKVVYPTREQAASHMAMWPRVHRGHLERRRAPGLWERVDPEPDHE